MFLKIPLLDNGWYLEELDSFRITKYSLDCWESYDKKVTQEGPVPYCILYPDPFNFFNPAEENNIETANTYRLFEINYSKDKEHKRILTNQDIYVLNNSGETIDRFGLKT